jgi:hypothetical protein
MIGGAALAIWFDIDPAGQEDFDAWYPRQHLPERLSLPGFRRGRRYAALEASSGFFTLYETAEAGVLSSPAYLERLNNPTDWTRRVLPHFQRMTRNAYRLLAASPADAAERELLTVRIKPDSGRGPYVRDWLEKDGMALVTAQAGAGACGFYLSDGGGTSVVTEERRLVGGEVLAATPFLALCELADPAAAPALRALWEDWARRIAAEVQVDSFRLLYGLRWI